MADNKNRSFLNEYEKFRTFLRTIFFFGSFTIDDFLELEELGIKKTQYQNLKIIAEDIIDKLFSRKEKNKDALKYNVEQFEMNYNYLSESYFIKTLTALEASTTIAILIAVSNPDGCTESDLYDLLQYQDEKTVKKRIRTLMDNGLIVCTDGRFRIAHNPFNDLKQQDFLRLLCFVDFQKGRIYPTCLGAFLFSTMRNLYERKFQCTYESPFVMKSNHLGNILDDEIQWNLLQAISAGETVSFTYRKNDSDFQVIRDIIPCRLMTEGQQNRVYLFGIRRTKLRDEKRFYRLDKISGLKTTGNNPEKYTDSYMQSFYLRSVQDSFSHTPISATECTVLELQFDACMQTEIERQFSNVSIDEQTHIATVSVRSNNKVLNPWLRAHADTIRIINDCPIKESFDQEIQEMKKLYGIIS